MYEFQVEGMSCGGCANSVKRTVQAIDGKARVEVDLASKTVRIDTAADIEAVKSAVSGAGFPVTASATV
jgi:copper chaperone